jgi:hypothetical protein
MIKNGEKYYHKWLKNEDFLFEIYRRKVAGTDFSLLIYALENLSFAICQCFWKKENKQTDRLDIDQLQC